MKLNKSKIIHIFIIILGTVFISISAMHTNIWFDESYSVGLASHSFIEIWKIGGNDVHPVLYYWILHIIYLVFGNNIVVYRLFSVVCTMFLGIVGYTHIRKDLGEKTGIIFSFLTFFMPVVSVYAVEIRMYSLACLLATLMFIYAYRLFRYSSKKNWIIFSVCSLGLSYTHYYGLMTAGITNLVLFVFAIKKKNENKGFLKYFCIQAVIEVLLYIPWLLYFIAQLKHVGGGFWISIKFPDTLVEILNFQYRGIMDAGVHFDFETIGTVLFSIILYIYIGILIYKQIKQKKDVKIEVFAFLIYISVIIAAFIISKFVVVLYYRYLFVITGILTLGISICISKEKNKAITILILGLMTLMSIFNEYRLTIQNYDASNMKQIEYVKENIKKDDIIIYTEINNIVYSIYLPENKQYFMNLDNWGVEEAYKAYGPQMATLRNFDFLNEYKGRIWIIDTDNQKIYNLIKNENVNIILENKKIETKYRKNSYNIMLINKN